jgi:hypothetical protein
MSTTMKQALISSAAAILIAGAAAMGVGWYLSPPRLEPTQPATVAKLPKLPDGIDVAFRCDGIIIAVIEKALEGSAGAELIYKTTGLGVALQRSRA